MNVRVKELIFWRYGVSFVLLPWLVLSAPPAAQHEHVRAEPEKLGTVQFATSCIPAVQTEVNRAIALLHSFSYQKADAAFAAIAKEDPGCELIRNGDQWSASLVDIQRKTISAWILFAQKQKDKGLSEMRAAADQEDAIDRPPVAPGPLMPARELLGEMLLEAHQPVLALDAFETDLRRAPGRLNGLYGAARAAEQAKERTKAQTYFSELLANCQEADPEQPAVREARAFQLGGK